MADRVEIGPDDLGRGAGLLDLGNELDRPGPGQGRAEVTDGRGLGRLGLQLLQRHPPPRRGDLPALRGHDLVEDICCQDLPRNLEENESDKFCYSSFIIQ